MIKEIITRWVISALKNNEELRVAITDAIIAKSNQETLLSALTVDYNLIEGILERATEDSFVEFKNYNTNTGIVVGKSAGKVVTEITGASRYY